MLSHCDLQSWYIRLGLPEQARHAIDHIRSSDPSRHVRSGHANVTGRYPSRKMGFTIQFESHRVELAAVYDLEHDAEVLEYWDQPGSIKLAYESAHGRHLGVFHTPDYFVIRRTEAGWEECKTEEDLQRLAGRNPNATARRATGFGAVRPARCTRKASGSTIESARHGISTGCSKGTSSFWKITCAQSLAALPAPFGKQSSLSYRLAPALRCPTYLTPAQESQTAMRSIR